MADRVPTPEFVLRGHKAQVHVTVFIRDSERLVTGDADGFVVLWDLAIMRPTVVWRAHSSAILGIQGWGRDKIITHGRDHELIVWRLAVEDEPGLSVVLPVDIVGPAPPRPWMLYLLAIDALNFCPFSACAARSEEDDSGLDAASEITLAVPSARLSQAIDIHTLPQPSPPQAVEPGFKNGMPMSLRLLHHRGRLTLLAGFENGYASVLRQEAAGHWITTYRAQAHTQPILSLDVHPSRDFFLTSAADSIIAKHPVPTSRRVLAPAPTLSPPSVREEGSREPSAQTSLLSDALRSSSVPAAALPRDDSEAWQHPLKTVNTKHAGQQSLTIRSDGRIFATAGWDSRIRIYSAKSLRELAVLHWHKVGAYAVTFARLDAAGPSLADHPTSASPVQESALSRPSGGVVSWKPDVKERRLYRARTTHWVASGAKDGKVSLWDVY